MNVDHRIKIISLWYHNDLSIVEINRQFNRMFTEKQIAKVIVESKMYLDIENDVIAESTLNYTNRLQKKNIKQKL